MLDETTAEAPASGPEAAPPDPPDLKDSSLYFNRELSWLDFNQRVLELAEDTSVPLLERVKFCAIYASNLDEFFMVRVAGLERRIAAGVAVPSASGLQPREVLGRPLQIGKGGLREGVILDMLNGRLGASAPASNAA